MNRSAALLVLAAVVGCESPVSPYASSFQPGAPNEDVTVTDLSAPSFAARGDTIEIRFAVHNNTSKRRLFHVQASLDSIAAPADAAAAFTLDIVELGQQQNPHCALVNPDASGQVSEWFEPRSSKTYAWHWIVARLSCAPPGSEPATGEYWLTSSARYVRQNGLVVSGWQRRRFAVVER